MSQFPITERQIQNGEKLVRLFDANHVPLESAFWVLHPSGKWMLALFSSALPGPKDFFEKLQHMLGSQPDLRPVAEDIAYFPPTSPLPRLAGMMFRTSPTSIGSNFSYGNAVGGIVLPPMVIYRNAPPLENASTPAAQIAATGGEDAKAGSS